MPRRPVAALFVGAVLVLAACGSNAGASSPAPATATASAAPTASPSEQATTNPSEPLPTTSASPGASVCRQTDDSGIVRVSIADFEFKPASIEAKVGQVVSFSNTGFEPHNATTAEGGCGTRTLQTGESDGLVFSVSGSYQFGCTVHPWMAGTFTIAP